MDDQPWFLAACMLLSWIVVGFVSYTLGHDNGYCTGWKAAEKLYEQKWRTRR